MKIVIFLIFIVDYIVCEVPPPYPPRIVKPQTRYGVPNRESVLQPQTVYGPPNNAEPLDPSFRQQPNPAKFQNPINNINPQNTVFQRPPQRYLGPPQSNAVALPQTIYGPPKPFNTIPQTTYGVPDKQVAPQNQNNFAAFQPNSVAPNRQPEPSRNYGSPSIETIYGTPKPSNSIPQTTYGVPDKQIAPQNQNNFAKYQPDLIAPNRQSEPSRNYGTPSIDSATLEEIKQLRELIQKIQSQRIAQASVGDNRHGQSLPNKEAGNFREQYSPVREPDNFKKDVSLEFNRQQGARQNVGNQNFDQNNFNFPRENQPALPTNYLPSQQNNNQFNTGSQGFPANQPTNPANTWNNLDLPSRTNSDVDIQKVEVTQFGPNRNINKNNDFGGTTYRPESNTNEGEINNKYIPPTTTENPTINFPSTLTPLDTTTPSNLYDTPQDESAGSPNIAIATAVAGAPNDQQYYLLQPDGRYQRIILAKPRDQPNKQISLPANYQLYQNLQVDPNVLYTPLYTVVNK